MLNNLENPLATILIIDDEPSVRLAIRKVLERDHHDVIEAADGHEGIDCFHDFPLDLVITDILMPEVYGLEVIRTIRKENPTLPILTITAYAPARLTLAKELGSDYTLKKPFSIDELLQIVNKALNSNT